MQSSRESMKDTFYLFGPKLFYNVDRKQEEVGTNPNKKKKEENKKNPPTTHSAI